MAGLKYVFMPNVPSAGKVKKQNLIRFKVHVILITVLPPIRDHPGLVGTFEFPKP